MLRRIDLSAGMWRRRVEGRATIMSTFDILTLLSFPALALVLSISIIGYARWATRPAG